MPQSDIYAVLKRERRFMTTLELAQLMDSNRTSIARCCVGLIRLDDVEVKTLPDGSRAYRVRK